MYRFFLRVLMILMAATSLVSFRMPVSVGASEKLLYDVRGAFVTARPDVPRGLVTAIDTRVDEAIRATVRSVILPRTILTIRITRAAYQPLLLGGRHEADVTVEAVAVRTGEAIATGDFSVAAFLLDSNDADGVLAERITQRIAGEFRLDNQTRSALTTALSP